MEELKFYDVKIGKLTKAGNLNVFQSFVAKSDKNQNDVYRYYLSKYKGFDISVEEIKEIVEDNITTAKEKDWYDRTPEQVEILQLKEKISKLESKKPLISKSFSGTFTWNRLSSDITKGIKEMEELVHSYNKKKKETEEMIRKAIREKYSYFPIGSISLKDWSENTANIPYEIFLDGKILFSDNEL